jgi:tape measure domain-containing protein
MNFKVRYQITADNRQAKQAFQEIENLQKRGRQGSSGSSIGDIFGGNLAADAVGRLTSKLYDSGAAVLNHASNLEQARIAMGTLMGSTEAANRHLNELMQLSRQTPLDFNAIAKMSQRLQGAGLEAKGLTALIKDIGNIAAATGELTADRMEGIGVAISQVFSKGKVSAEEMEQLAERGVPAWRILSETLGKTTGETRKLAEQGKITSQQFVDAFQKFSRMNYGDAMEKQAATFSGAMGKITNILMQTANTAFQPIFEKISRFADDVADSLSEQEAKAGQAGVSFGMAIGEGIGEGIRRSRGPEDGWVKWLFGYYPGKIAFDLGWDIAAGIDKGLKSFDDTAQLGGRTVRINPQTFTLEEVPGATAAPRVTAPPPGASTGDADAKKAEREAEQRRREAERMAERDLAAAIRIEEMNFDTIKDQFSEQFDELRRVFNEDGDVSRFFGGMTAAMERYKGAVGDSLKFLEELENRGRSAMTEHEQALLTAQQQERRNAIVKQGQDEARRNNAELVRQQEEMGGLVIARYQREKEIADELERQAKAIREQLRSMLMMPGYDASGNETMRAPEGSAGGFFGEGGFGGGLKAATGDIKNMEDVMQSLGRTAEDMFMQMGAGLGSMVESWVLMGDQADVSMRKMVAAVLAGVAAQAATLSIFHLAMGIAALTPWGAVMYGPAPLHFKAAALWGAVAVGAALGGRAAAGDSFKDKGSSGPSASSRSGSSSSGSLTPISRQTDTTFMSGRQPMSEVHALLISKAIEKLESKISGMRPGDVVAAGAKQNPEAIGNGFVHAVQRNSSIGTKARKAMGGER